MKNILIFLLLLLSACTNIQKRIHTKTRDVKREKTETLIDKKELNLRIDSLHRLINDPSISDRKKGRAIALLDFYNDIKALIRRPYSPSLQKQLLHRVFHELGKVESAYLRHKDSKGKKDTKDISLYMEYRAKIVDSYLSEDFEAAIHYYNELKSAFGHKIITEDLDLIYALSLGKAKRINEAIALGENILTDLQRRPDSTHLLAKLALWQLELGNLDRALSISERLTDISDDRQELIDSVRREINSEYIKIEDEHEPEDTIEGAWSNDEPVVTPLENSKTERAEDIPEPPKEIDLLLLKIEMLVSEKRFEEARELLLSKKETDLSEEDMDIIDHALESIDSAMEKDNSKQPAPEKRLEEITATREDENMTEGEIKRDLLEKAKKLFEEERFEEALTALNGINDDIRTDSELKDLKERTVKRVIQTERNKAAKLFLSAKKANTLKTKIEYLRHSSKLLEGLVERFPSSPMLPKIISNLEKVTNELYILNRDKAEHN